MQSSRATERRTRVEYLRGFVALVALATTLADLEAEPQSVAPSQIALGSAPAAAR